MSKWLDLARADQVDFGDFGNSGTASLPEDTGSRAFGTNGTIGTAPRADHEGVAGQSSDPNGAIGTNGTASLISPEEVRALWDITADRIGDDDHATVTPIVRANLRNDPRLAPAQYGSGTCLICSRPDQQGNVLLPFLSAVEGRHHWMHAGECHAEHCRRQAEKAEDCLRAAGIVLH